MNNTKSICDEFKEQVWLYLEPEAESQMKNFWDRHLANCSECSNHLKATREFLSTYNEIPEENLEEEKFNSILNLVTSKKKFSLLQNLNLFLQKIKHEFSILGNYKIAFGSTLIVLIFALIMFFKEYRPKIEIKQKQTVEEVKPETPAIIFEEKTPVEEVETRVVKRVGGVNTKPKVYKASLDDHWDIDIQSISIQIDLLKKQTDELEF